jgi:hypothetical protein
VGTGLHLLASDVEQHTGEVPSMLGVTKVTVNLLQLAVLLLRWTCTVTKDGILLPQPLNLVGGVSGTLLVRCCMLVLVVLYWRLNRYCVYLANEVIPEWK